MLVGANNRRIVIGKQSAGRSMVGLEQGDGILCGSSGLGWVFAESSQGSSLVIW
jgi:hypothetical protein